MTTSINDGSVVYNGFKGRIVIGTAVKEIGDSAFGGTTKVSVIEYNAVNANDREQGNGIFENCGIGVEGITVYIGTGVTRVPAYMFNPTSDVARKANIEHIVFVDNESTFTGSSIGAYAFASCTSLRSVVLPRSLTAIGVRCFNNCKNLPEITVPENTEYIAAYAFDGCSALEAFNVKSKIIDLHECIINDAASIKEFRFEGALNEWHDLKKHENWLGNASNFTVICTDGEIEY
jgi:hypothetical protein